jgi:hypothetical protein
MNKMSLIAQKICQIIGNSVKKKLFISNGSTLQPRVLRKNDRSKMMIDKC